MTEIESKVCPSGEHEELNNDYIVYNCNAIAEPAEETTSTSRDFEIEGTI